MEDDEPRKEYPVSPAKLSKTPSWIMLGFVLGALFVVSLPRRDPPAAKVEEPRPAEPARTADPEPPQLTTIEAVFAEWGHLAVWSDDTTEVALWNSDTKAFSDFYEVRRIEGLLYFRSLPQLTRRVITRGKPLPGCPLQFTETEEQYREWLEHGRSERPLERTRPARPNSTPVERVKPSVETASPPVAPPRVERITPPLGAAPEKAPKP